MAQWKNFVGGPIWWRNKSKMADGRHLGFRFWAIISALINIFAPNLVQWWKIGSPRRPSAQKSDFSKIQDGGRPQSWISILGHNFRYKQNITFQHQQLKHTYSTTVWWLSMMTQHDDSVWWLSETQVNLECDELPATCWQTTGRRPGTMLHRNSRQLCVSHAGRLNSTTITKLQLTSFHTDNIRNFTRKINVSLLQTYTTV